MAVPHGRHRSSLEGFIDFSAPEPLDPKVQADATRLLLQLLDHFEPSQETDQYKRFTLLRAIHDHTPSKDTFLTHLFLKLGQENMESQGETDPNLSRVLSYMMKFESMTTTEKDKIGHTMSDFAELIFEHFLLPVKAAGGQTPQVSPTRLLGNQDSRHESVGTPRRVSALRAQVLQRDCYRCVVCRRFDRSEAARRKERDGDNAKDDQGCLLQAEKEDLESLEVAHILPHSLVSLKPGADDLTDSKKTALEILDMFDPGIRHVIDGVEVDHPRNAVSLTHSFHSLFGSFKMYFEPTPDSPPHTYRIETTETSFMRPRILPVTRTLFLSPNRDIDPPLPRLLQLHRAITQIFFLSGAGEYSDKILQEFETTDCKEDGSSALGHYVALRCGGWLNGVAVY